MQFESNTNGFLPENGVLLMPYAQSHQVAEACTVIMSVCALVCNNHHKFTNTLATKIYHGFIHVHFTCTFYVGRDINTLLDRQKYYEVNVSFQEYTKYDG